MRLIATSAVRDAANRHELDFYLAAIAPMMLTRIISGEEKEGAAVLHGRYLHPPPRRPAGYDRYRRRLHQVALGDAGAAFPSPAACSWAPAGC